MWKVLGSASISISRSSMETSISTMLASARRKRVKNFLFTRKAGWPYELPSATPGKLRQISRISSSVIGGLPWRISKAWKRPDRRLLDLGVLELAGGLDAVFGQLDEAGLGKIAAPGVAEQDPRAPIAGLGQPGHGAIGQ